MKIGALLAMLPAVVLGQQNVTATVEIPPSLTLAVIIPIQTTAATTQYTTITTLPISTGEESPQTTNALSVLSSALATFPASLLPMTTYSFSFAQTTKTMGTSVGSSVGSGVGSAGPKSTVTVSTVVVSGQPTTVTLLSSGGSLISVSAASTALTAITSKSSSAGSSAISSAVETTLTTITSTSTPATTPGTTSALIPSSPSSSTPQTSGSSTTTQSQSQSQSASKTILSSSTSATHSVTPATTTAAPPINAAVGVKVGGSGLWIGLGVIVCGLWI